MADEVTKKTPAEEAAEHIIPETALEGKGVSAQPNPMELPEDEAKAVFDQIAKEIIIPAFNDFVVFMAAQLGLIDWTKDAAKPISTATQAALDKKHDKELKTGSTEENPVYRTLTDNNFTDKQVEQLKKADTDRHTHANKSLLDKLTEQDIKNWNGENVLTKDNTTPYTPTLPYHPATIEYVLNHVKKIGAADMTQAMYDPQNRKTDIFAAIDEAMDAAKFIKDDVTGEKYFLGVKNGALYYDKAEVQEVAE